jgi:sugar transferase (PEP-CTERM system associated)
MIRIFRKNYPIRNVFFVISEGVFIFTSVYIASWIILGTELLNIYGYQTLKILLITVVCQISLYYNDLYEVKVTQNVREVGLRLIQALGFAAIILAIIYIFVPKAVVGTGTFLISVGIIVIIIVSWRFCYATVLDRGLFNQRIILLGSADLLEKIKQEINERKDCGYIIVAEVPDAKHKRNSDNPGPKNSQNVIGHKYEGLSDLAQAYNIEKIVVALEEKRNNFPTKELLKCRVNGIEVIDGNSFYEMLTGKLVVKAINPSWLIFSEGFRQSRTRRLIKRFADLLLAGAMLIVFLPLIVVIALLIKIDSKGPVIFSQERVGQNAKIYRIYKFRSMVEDAEKISGPIWAQDDDKRITRVGKIIRKLRMDELPQLWNILKGDMSFVGPRPEREHFVKELEELIPYYRERHTVKPGLSGWAQVSYRYGASVDDAIEKLNYDLFYIKNMSFLMDLMIVLRTIKIVLFRKGSR